MNHIIKYYLSFVQVLSSYVRTRGQIVIILHQLYISVILLNPIFFASQLSIF